MYNEDEYLESLKKDDHYHFSVPFEYIKKNLGDDNYELAELTMEVDVDWDDSNNGYQISYDAPGFYEVDPNEGNGSLEEFFDSAVEDTVLSQLSSLGITSEAIMIY